ncbi:MAG TPA: phosphotransferase family protein [Candidatus Dormibacteraeota bacterium]|nr:phosphotransferase family protein [Candidatus Dormibacteraeota bacterium]
MTDQIRSDLEKAIGKRVTSVESIPEGHSGFTYFVIADDGEYVLRLPPPGARIAATADVMRQGRIMSALHAAGLPVPAVPVICSDPIVDGRPFVLMERVDGVRIERAAPDATPRELTASAVGVLKRMQALPLEKTGIGNEESIPLQVEMMRWAMLMQRAPEELTSRAGELGGLLAAQVPVERKPTLVHGDYHPGNMLFRGRDVVAILDWEIAEIGQPLLDLGALCVVPSRHPGEWPALPDAEVIELYGVEPEEMRWYLAMTLYKYASIFGYNLMLHRRGKRPDPMYEGLTTTIVAMIDEGIRLL